MSQEMSCLFTIISMNWWHYLEIPLHKLCKRVMNFDVFIILSAHKL